MKPASALLCNVNSQGEAQSHAFDAGQVAFEIYR